MLRKSTEIASVWVEDPVYMTLRRSFLCVCLVGFYNHLAPDGALPRNNPRRGWYVYRIRTETEFKAPSGATCDGFVRNMS